MEKIFFTRDRKIISNFFFVAKNVYKIYYIERKINKKKGGA